MVMESTYKLIRTGLNRLAFFALLLFSILVIYCNSTKSEHLLDVEQFEKAASKPGAQVLDVRTAPEFQTGHIAHALQADWKNQYEFQDRAEHLDKIQPVYVYCAAGTRSAAAADWLRKKGYQVFELDGGMKSWKQKNKTIDVEPNEKPISLSEYKVMAGMGQVVLVDFGAEWCPPCKKMDPVIDDLRKDMGDKVRVVKIDAGMQAELMKLVSAEKIPTFIIYKNGTEVWRKEGIVPIDELKRNIN
ncbi:MAG: rhodanese-like domain-containing protein [Flavitalea sp.]